MKKWLMTALVLSCGLVSAASRSHLLPEITKPDIVLARFDHLYILEKATVYVYSLRDFKLIKTFGREGEGPGEFKTRAFGPPLTMAVHQENLWFNSMNKILRFSRDGDFVSEMKAPPNLVFYPLLTNYVAIGPVREEGDQALIHFRLLDQQFTERKILHKTDVDTNLRYIQPPYSGFTYNPVYKDRLYLVGSNSEFVIKVLDVNGNLLYTIEKELPRIKVSAAFRTGSLEWFKVNARFKQFYDWLQKTIRFKDYFPAIRDLHVADDTLHVITYQRRNGLWECILLDLEGREQRRIFIPLSEYEPYTYYPLLYSVCRSTIYSLVPDDVEEGWQVISTSIE